MNCRGWIGRNFEAFALTALAIIVIPGHTLRAEIILFSDLGPGDSYIVGSGFLVSGSASDAGLRAAPAMSFTPAVTAAVASVAFGINSNSGTNSVTFDLATDNGGTPGTVIESYTFINQMASVSSGQEQVLTADSSLNPVLDAGTSYWMIAFPGAPDTDAIWGDNNQGAVGGTSVSHNGGENWAPTKPEALAAFEVVGEASAVPEPSTLLLLVVAASFLIGYRWRVTCPAPPAREILHS